jgi:FMN-dependent oxidoreductase (nitrilotriacetate monooxygenase family)
LRESIQLPVNDPTLLVSAMAAVTENLGFGVTVNLTYEQPYLLARRFSTLDHLTQGRIGWNIVTGYLDSAARAMGLNEQLPHDERYERADEYLDILYKLWEGSWEEGAVLRDKVGRVYADPAKVHQVKHAGRYYNVEGYHLAEPSPQRTPVLFQAGSSGRGQRFAARHAECVFISPPNRTVGRETVRTLREQLVEAGRKPDDVKVFVGAAVVTGATESEAREKHADYLRYASREAGLAHFAASTGIDYAQYDLDEPVDYAPTNAIESATRTAKQHGWTRRKLLDMFEMGGRYPAIVGTAAQVADELQAWVEETGVDGFNLSRTVVPESYEDFIDLVVPELQNRGLYKTSYEDGALRHKLFGEGDQLPERHAAASFRRRATEAV